MKKMKNKKFKIIITPEYEENLKDVKRFFSERYYNKLRKTAKNQISCLRYMPRMYQRLFVKNKIIRRVQKNSLGKTYYYL